MRFRSTVAAALATACLLAAAPAPRAQGTTPVDAVQSFSKPEIDKAVAEVRTDPNIGGTRTIRTLRWRTTPQPRRSSWPSWLSWVGDLLAFVMQSGRAIFWVAIVALALFLAVYLVRVLSSRQDDDLAGGFTAPTHVRDLDIRPESLPPDIGAAARRLWDEGDHRAALALLYRGLLSRLAHVHQVPIRDSTTEGDTLMLSAGHLDITRHGYVTRLVTVWQRAVYGGADADGATVYELCDGFGPSLNQAASAAGAGQVREATA